MPPGSDGLITLPYFMGAGAPAWDPLARGVLFGLSLSHTRAHVIRSLLESVAFEILLNIDAIEALGWPLETLYLSGGGSRSTVWREIICDVTGKRVCIPSTESAPSLGAAILAAVGAGLHPDVPTAVRTMTRITSTLEPDPARHARYRKYYALYRDVYRCLAPAYRELDQIIRDQAEQVPTGGSTE